jgi:cell division transport system ATP-binding protein
MSFNTQPVLSLKNVDIYQDQEIVLCNVSFSLHKGEFCYLIGQTGSGKSSLLKTLYKDLPLQQGSVKIAGYYLKHLKEKELPLLRRKLGIIFQDFQLFYDRSVSDNLEFVLKATGWRKRSKRKQRISEVLMQVGLESSAAKSPHQLSGGEQQRLVIGRALLNDPVVLLADEPTGNLDPMISEEIMQLFLQINRSGTTILMATHNQSLLLKHPKRTLTLTSGSLSSTS